jgi:hypothetical protein
MKNTYFLYNRICGAIYIIDKGNKYFSFTN